MYRFRSPCLSSQLYDDTTGQNAKYFAKKSLATSHKIQADERSARPTEEAYMRAKTTQRDRARYSNPELVVQLVCAVLLAAATIGAALIR